MQLKVDPNSDYTVGVYGCSDPDGRITDDPIEGIHIIVYLGALESIPTEIPKGWNMPGGTHILGGDKEMIKKAVCNMIDALWDSTHDFFAKQ